MAVAAISRQKTAGDADEQRWQLVLAHSPAAKFFYAVISTKIYCRPTCPSRRPRRANVCFFDTHEAAKAAGFRACKRCKPDALEEPNSDATARETVEAACNYIRSVNGDTKLADIANHVNLSPRYFHGLFKQVTGVTPGVFSSRIRQQNHHTIAAAAHFEGSTAAEPVDVAALSDTLSPGSELLVTPTMQSPLIDDFMLSFYGSADAYAELDGLDMNNPASWESVLNFDNTDQLFELNQFAYPLNSSQKSATAVESDPQFIPTPPPVESISVTDLDGFSPYTAPG